MVPQLSCSYTNSLRLPSAYFSPVGTKRLGLACDRLDSTKTGRRDKISMPGYSKLSPQDSLLVKLFVAEYRPKQGMPLSPARDDRLIMALFLPREFMPWSNLEVMMDMEVQLTFITSTICQCETFRWQPTQLQPTLLMRRHISSTCSYFIIASTSSFFDESLKSKTIVLNCDFYLFPYWSLLSNSTVELSFSLFLEIKTMLNPILVKTLQKPRPIPSVAPVTTAQLSLSLWQYLFLRSGMGRISLIVAKMTQLMNLNRGQPNNMSYRYMPQKIHEGKIEVTLSMIFIMVKNNENNICKINSNIFRFFNSQSYVFDRIKTDKKLRFNHMYTCPQGCSKDPQPSNFPLGRTDYLNQIFIYLHSIRFVFFPIFEIPISKYPCKGSILLHFFFIRNCTFGLLGIIFRNFNQNCFVFVCLTVKAAQAMLESFYFTNLVLFLCKKCSVADITNEQIMSN